jgi:hypothetical protein
MVFFHLSMSLSTEKISKNNLMFHTQTYGDTLDGARIYS